MGSGTDPHRIGLITGSGLTVDALTAALGRSMDAEIAHERVVVDGGSGEAGHRAVASVGPIVVLARHQGGRPAHLVDHVANLRALQAAGCDRVLGVASVGSLRHDWPVGTVVVPDDVFAPTTTVTTHDTPAGHRVANFAATWRAQVVAAWSAVPSQRPVHDGGVYAQTTGPRFETPAEVRFLGTVADVVGMTVASEMMLAGEIGIAYAAICQVDNLGNGMASSSLEPGDLREAAAANEQRLLAEVSATVLQLATA